MQPWPGLAPYVNPVHLPASCLTIHSYQAGADEAPAMLLIHGLGDEADTWRSVFAPLATHYRVIAPDLPGFGRSDKPARAYSVPFFSAALQELLQVLGISRAVLVGHSLGAGIAQWTALEQPGLAERLVLIDGALVIGKQTLKLATLLFLIPGIGEFLYNRLRRDPQAAYASLEPYYAHLDRLPEAERRFLYRRVNERVWSDGQRRAYLSALRSLAGWTAAQQRQAPARITGANLPTRIIWGEQDALIPVVNAHALSALQPSACLTVIPEAGHMPHQEQSQDVIKAILAG